MLTTRTITLTLPEDLYARLEAQAQQTARPVNDVVAQALARGLMVANDPELAPAVQAELAAMEQLADAVLWNIAGSTANNDTIALYDLLTQRQQAGTFSAEGQQWLDRVRAEADLAHATQGPRHTHYSCNGAIGFQRLRICRCLRHEQPI